MDVFQSMSVFVRVAETESFTRTAEELGITQSSVSKTISNLEKRLGTKLINRSTRRMRLTDAGASYHQRARSLLLDVAEMEADVSDAKAAISGTIKIAVPDTFGRYRILPKLWEFLAEHPDLDLDILIEDRRIDLLRDGVDVAIRSGSSFDPTMVTRKLASIERVLVASPNYIKANSVPSSIEDLKQHQCVLYSLVPSGKNWTFVSGKEKRNIRVTGRVRVSSPEAAVEAALDGFGITLSPLWLVEDHIRSGELVPVMPSSSPEPFEVHAIFPERRFIPKRVKALVEFIRASL
ncbi:D-malate degradation protein R [Roseibium album]|nr:D-malate degradation protein R [Roseibium album]